MATRSRATFAKRQREIARQERARDKAAKRVERNEQRVKLDRSANDDPDLMGIVPGPQARLYDLPEEEKKAEEDAEEEDK